MGYSTWDIGGCNCPGGSSVVCGTCAIPAPNLTVFWTNILTGNGSATLVWNGVSKWQSACIASSYIYDLACVSGVLTFSVSNCSGVLICDTAHANPNRINTVSLTCGASFDWKMSISSASCSTLAMNGFTNYEVTP